MLQVLVYSKSNIEKLQCLKYWEVFIMMDVIKMETVERFVREVKNATEGLRVARPDLCSLTLRELKAKCEDSSYLSVFVKTAVKYIKYSCPSCMELATVVQIECFIIDAITYGNPHWLLDMGFIDSVASNIVWHGLNK
jgi:hypothetical protein